MTDPRVPTLAVYFHRQIRQKIYAIYAFIGVLFRCHSNRVLQPAGTSTALAYSCAVHVGVCRREFGINNSELDFTPGHDFSYVFGDGANVIDAADNDPRTLLPPDTNDATQFPRYIRHESSDAWDLEEIGITLNPANRARSC